VQHAEVVRDQGIPELGRRVERDELKLSLAAEVARMPKEQQMNLMTLDAAALRAVVKKAARIELDIAPPAIKAPIADIVVWANEQGRLLRAAAHANTKLPIDWENVAKEIEASGKNYSRDLSNNLFKVLKHLVQLDIATEEHRGRKGWYDKINKARGEIQHLLASAASLRPTIGAVIAESLFRAKEAALEGMSMGDRRVIELGRLSYSEEQVINDWFPMPPSQPKAESDAIEQTASVAATKVGLLARKSPLQRSTLRGFQLVDKRSRAVVAGDKFDLTAERVLEICADRAGKT
jgi:hypothetical protein